MSRHRISLDPYGLAIVAAYTLLTAMVVFFMALPLSVKLTCLVVSAGVYAVSIRPDIPDNPPMGAATDPEGIVRPPLDHDTPGRQPNG